MRNGSARYRLRRGVQRAALALLSLAGAAAVAAAEPAPAMDRGARPVDAMALLPTSSDSWSVSDTGAGCFLLSPRQQNSIGLAVGWSTKRQPALLLTSFALALAGPNATEKVRVQAGDGTFETAGRMVGSRQFFVPVDTNEMKSVLRELGDTGTLWLEIRHTWIAHSGRGLPAAMARYRSVCGAAW
jgi:hypothetical protein